MILYMACTTEDARQTIDGGFVGVERYLYDVDDSGRMVQQDHPTAFCEFRDIAPSGWTVSRTTEIEAEQTGEDQIRMTVSGGPVLADFTGDFTLTIEVPDDEVFQYEAKEEDPSGWPFREFYLPPEVANQYRHTLKVYDPEDGEEVRPDLVGR